MRKVLVIGPGGSGKSTFATRLGELLKIEVVRLLGEHSESKQVVWLRSNAEVEKFLHALQNASRRGTPDGQT